MGKFGAVITQLRSVATVYLTK